MRISSAEVIPYALPFRRPYLTAAGRLERREIVLLRLRSEEGLVGLGEAVPLSLRGGAGLAQVLDELETLASGGALQRFLERDQEPDSTPEGLSAISAPARCAALTALLDLRERGAAAGHGSAGARSADAGEEHPPSPIPCNATLVAGDPEGVAEDALGWAAEGFSTFKLKVGTGADIEQVTAVREAVGADARIRIDANGAWSLAQAELLLAALEPLDIELVEQPVSSMEEAAELSRRTRIPLAGDESIVSAADAVRAKESAAFSLTGVKLSKVGGIAEALEIGAVLPAYVSSALDGPVGIAAGARLALALPDAARRAPGSAPLAHGLATQRLFASTVAAVECEIRDGLLHPPPGPGLGIEIDEDALRAHRL